MKWMKLVSLMVVGCVGTICAGQEMPAQGTPGQSRGGASSGPTWQELQSGRLTPPPVKVEPAVQDFGDLPINTKISANFRLTNTGAERLVILAAMSTCWCTVGEVGERVIEPGKSVEIPVTFDSGPYIQEARREVLVRFEGYNRGVALPVHASVHYGIRAQVEYTPPDQRRVGKVTLESSSGAAFDVLSANGRAVVFADGFDPERDDPRSRYTIAWDLTGYEAEKLPPLFVIETNDESSPVIDLAVENFEWEPPRGMRPWQFTEFRHLLGRMDPSTTKEIVVTMGPYTGSALDALEDVWVEPAVADVRVMGTELTPTGLKVRMRIAPKAEFRGVLNASVQVSIGGYQDRFWLVGRVAENPSVMEGPQAMPQ